ncbi:MAG: hypothetical protein HY287_05710 [Planctomycetes bacterium]|nr:hypothetical protein [Planctomycetota bacterium]
MRRTCGCSGKDLGWNSRRCWARLFPLFCIVAVGVMAAGSGSAWGQSCGPGSPGAVDCDPGLEHGNGGTAACQNRCVGETLDCTATFRYLDQLLDPVLVKGAFDTVHGNVRDPASGNLSIILITGNAVCTNSGGVCNPANGTNCAFPCLIGPAGKGCSDAGTSLSLPAAPQNGSVRVADRNLYTILASDIGNLANTFTFTQRDLCDSACSDCPANDDSVTASSSSLVPNCNDSNNCTIDSCAIGACSHTPVTCDDHNGCTSDACNPANGQCVFTPNAPCDDNNACTTDTCNPANGQCVFTPNAPCDDNNACTDDSCNPATGVCVYTPNTTCDSCHTCNPATGVCDDNGTCHAETCRTPGFWDTHACGTDGVHCEKSNSNNLTQLAINECGGCLNICGDVINNTLLNNSDSALEAMCVAVTGTQRLQLVRQLTAAALNCCISGGGGACTGISIAEVFNACNAACASGGTTTHINGQIVDCVGALDDFNNGLISDCHDRILGTCSDGSICTEQLPCARGSCGAPGPAGSSNACNAAISNKCYVIGTSTCSTGGANGPQSCE